MERYSGRKERTEKFGGMRFRKVTTTHTKRRAELKKGTLMKEGFLVRIEPEAPGLYSIYRRRK
jgi:hypothetical protein